MTTRDIAELLAEHPFFEGLQPDQLELIAGCGRNVAFGEGDQILREGADADEFYVLRSGRVAVEIATPQGTPIVVETLGAGELLGVSWLFPPHRWAFDAVAQERTSATALDAACLRGKCDDDPVLGYALFKRFALLMRDRLQATRLQLLDVYGGGST